MNIILWTMVYDAYCTSDHRIENDILRTASLLLFKSKSLGAFHSFKSAFTASFHANFDFPLSLFPFTITP
jgi:hypothetical protein